MKKWIQKYTGFLRSFRLVYNLYNLLHLQQLKSNKVFYEKFKIKRFLCQSIAHRHIVASNSEIPWMDNLNITTVQIQSHPDFATFSAIIQQQLLLWPQNGFMQIQGLFTNEVNAINNEIETLQTQQKVDFNFTGRKIMDAWKQGNTIESVFKNEEIFKIISFIFQRNVIPFQTINFIYGSEQKPHSDSVHMTTEPLGYLAAIWIALEDIVEGSGELMYYPGSHKLPYLMSEHFDSGNNALFLGKNNYANYEEAIADVITKNNLTPAFFYAKKGDVFIWHANLLHGGSPITNPKQTRKSMVAHYYAQGVLCYHEISERPAILPK
jgi:ectoine hydroxylase